MVRSSAGLGTWRRTFAAFAGENDGAAVCDDTCRGAHAFHALVKIHVKGIAAVRSDDDIEGLLHLLHGRFADEFVASAVGFDEIARENAGDLAGFVEGDVQQKAGADAQGDIANFLPDRIANRNSKCRSRIANVAGVVIRHNRLQPGTTGHDPLRTAAEPGEEMRLDKAGDDAHIGLGEMLVDQGRCAVVHHPELLHGLRIFRLVIDHSVILDDFRREHFLQLFNSVRSMRAKLVQKRDLFARDEAEIVEKPGDEPIIRRGARNVREGDTDLRARRDPITQRLGGNRSFKSAKDGLLLVRQARSVQGLDDSGDLVRQINGEVALSVSQLYLHRRNLTNKP
jgi:hypothetical protein